jgi:hypothetical protein
LADEFEKEKLKNRNILHFCEEINVDIAEIIY